MTHTDFFDEDLVKPQVKVEPTATEQSGQEDAEPADPRASRRRDLNLARMSRHRDQLESQVATAMQEIERLRQKQEDLEGERRHLEILRKKQDQYVDSKRQVIQTLNQSLLALEKEEVRASQLTELYGSTRATFKAMLYEIESINETEWDEEDLRDDLDKAQDLVNASRVECSKLLAKLDAFGGPGPGGFSGEGVSSAEKRERPEKTRPGFAYWLIAGLAVSLPLSLVLGLVAVLVYVALTKWMI